MLTSTACLPGWCSLTFNGRLALIGIRATGPHSTFCSIHRCCAFYRFILPRRQYCSPGQSGTPAVGLWIDDVTVFIYFLNGSNLRKFIAESQKLGPWAEWPLLDSAVRIVVKSQPFVGGAMWLWHPVFRELLHVLSRSKETRMNIEKRNSNGQFT